jgi:hypothetical protein
MPEGNIARRINIALLLHIGQVTHQVCPNSIVRQRTTKFSNCEEKGVPYPRIYVSPPEY